MNTILFDLDGTLLPMDQDAFIQIYFKNLATHFIPFGYQPDTMMSAVNIGVKAMILNDGSMTNEERFWSVFGKQLGEDIRSLEPEFRVFYDTDFLNAKAATTRNPYTARIIKLLKEKGYTIVIATNPLFPTIATHNRIQWAGFSKEEVDYITTYEVSSYCKPNPNYYTEILEKLQKKPEDCMMVGNDVSEDMLVDQLGLSRYLVTDCLINSKQEDISSIPQGSLKDFYDYVQSLPKVE